ncbi:MAG: Mrp/NBP35 family ATP-binding protein [Propionibacteriaceae bacterium]|jgi:ATP-binding protein involved in chromosome partitioning|nr:Mrp/NBP35 family ATP-binding protein [Propionibacteriaceae bacterium]
MSVTESAVRAALSQVVDPEIRRPITELDMVGDIEISPESFVKVTILLTVAGCPMHAAIQRDVTAALEALDGVAGVNVVMGAMSDEQRAALTQKLHGGRTEPVIPFAQDDSLTQVILVASGKGGVGKSSVTVNLALALAGKGKKVGVLDADIYGHSVQQMLGLYDTDPTLVDDMILPVPFMGLSVISMGMFKESRDQVIAWRGPMLDRALAQFMTDVYWGDLDYLIVDLPPGTGDVALSMGQKLPNAEVIVVTTPQSAASEVAERAGTMASMFEQKLIGVIENMSYLSVTCPHCGEAHRTDVFGSGGGIEVAGALSAKVGYDVPLLAEVPMDPQVSVSGDRGIPYVALNPDSEASKVIYGIADHLNERRPSIKGKKLGVTVL